MGRIARTKSWLSSRKAQSWKLGNGISLTRGGAGILTIIFCEEQVSNDKGIVESYTLRAMAHTGATKCKTLVLPAHHPLPSCLVCIPFSVHCRHSRCLASGFPFCNCLRQNFANGPRAPMSRINLPICIVWSNGRVVWEKALVA